MFYFAFDICLSHLYFVFTSLIFLPTQTKPSCSFPLHPAGIRECKWHSPVHAKVKPGHINIPTSHQMQIIGIEIQLHQWLYFGGCVGHQANHNIIRHPPSCHSSYAPIVIDNYGATILLAFQWAVVSKTTGGARTTERLVCRKAKSSYLHSSLQVILCHPIDIEEYSSTCCCSYTDFACISNMFYACISDKCGIEVSC